MLGVFGLNFWKKMKTIFRLLLHLTYFMFMGANCGEGTPPSQKLGWWGQKMFCTFERISKVLKNNFEGKNQCFNIYNKILLFTKNIAPFADIYLVGNFLWEETPMWGRLPDIQLLKLPSFAFLSLAAKLLNAKFINFNRVLFSLKILPLKLLKKKKLKETLSLEKFYPQLFKYI